MKSQLRKEPYFNYSYVRGYTKQYDKNYCIISSSSPGTSFELLLVLFIIYYSVGKMDNKFFSQCEFLKLTNPQLNANNVCAYLIFDL